ncbi:TonB-dependent receptor [Vitreimonas sp.]|uniref:TonB-dependent receptor n=1 Tax=Vitreimonas sp. TaxID=3069702 RepID=UPI002EDB5D3F
MNRTHLLRAILCVSTSAAALVSAPAAFAQSSDPLVADGSEIVVTANRREETANTVGMGIQAFSGEQLDQLHVTDVRDLSSVAPSFSVQQSYQGVPIYTLRGIGFNTINLSATSTVGSYVDEVAYPFPFMMTGPIFDIQRVEVLKGPQGTLYGRNTTAGLVDFITNRPTDDIQASLTGEWGNYQTHNLEGYFSAPLSDNFRFRVAFRSEDSDEGWQESNTRDETQGEIHRLGGRARFEWDVTNDFLAELTLSAWENRSDTIVGQGIGFTPATDPALNPAAALFNAGGLYNPAAGAGLVNYIQNNFPTDSTQADWAPESVRSADIGAGAGLPGDLAEDNFFWAGALRLSWELPNDMRLVSLTGYNHLERDALSDWSGAPYEVLLQQLDGEVETFSQEVRIEGENERVRWLIGAYYGADEIQDNNRTLLGQNYNVARIRTVGQLILAGIEPLTYNPPGTINPLPGFYSPGAYTPLDMAQAFRTYRDLASMEAETRSVFANAEWALSDALSLTTAVRYTEDEHSYEGCSADFNGSMLANVNAVNRYLYTVIYALPTPTPITMNQCNTFNPITGQFGQVAHTLEEDNVSWRLGLDWQMNSKTLLYASVSQGYKAGVTPVNAASTSTQQAPATQESLLAYEVGAKLGLFDRAVQFNVSAFYYDYEDKQISTYFADPIYTALARLQNIPESRAYGVDLDVTWRATDNLTLIGSATYLDTAVIEYSGTGPAGTPRFYDDVAFPYSAEWQVSGTVLYERELSDTLGFQAALNGRWQDESAADLGDSPTFAIDSYGVLNASVGVHALNDRWALQVWGRNITDTYYWTSVASNANVVVRFPGMAPTYGASLTFNY